MHQDLYQICCLNNVSAIDGGFPAGVVVKLVGFLYSCKSDLHSSPSETQESASFQMITKLLRLRDSKETSTPIFSNAIYGYITTNSIVVN